MTDQPNLSRFSLSLDYQLERYTFSFAAYFIHARLVAPAAFYPLSQFRPTRSVRRSTLDEPVAFAIASRRPTRLVPRTSLKIVDTTIFFSLEGDSLRILPHGGTRLQRLKANMIERLSILL